MNRPSLTALGIAAARAMEQERPLGERIVDDPFARGFVGEKTYRLLSFVGRPAWSERRGPGVLGYLMARERAIDETLLRTLDEGLDQLVILGAGYDARAFRFAKNLAGVHVFEVDHPTTQAAKRAKAEKMIDASWTPVTYVPVDFNTQDLGNALLHSGYDASLRTLFLWQGVVMYLTSSAIDATLSFVRMCAAPGSAIVFDYVANSALDGDQARPEVLKTNRYGRISGERIQFTLDPAQATQWLEARGFVCMENVRSEDFAARYLTGAAAQRPIAQGYGLLVGRVPV